MDTLSDIFAASMASHGRWDVARCSAQHGGYRLFRGKGESTARKCHYYWLSKFQRSLRARGHTAVPATPWGAYDPGTATWGIPRVLFCRSVPYTAIAAPPGPTAIIRGLPSHRGSAMGYCLGPVPGGGLSLPGGLWGGTRAVEAPRSKGSLKAGKG